MMGQEACFSFVTIDFKGQWYALTVDIHDKYAPKKTGMYKVDVQKFKKGDKSQMFSYDPKT